MRTIGTILLFWVFLGILGCATRPLRLDDEDMPRLLGETEFLLEDDRGPGVEIDPRALADRPIEAVIVRAFQESDVPIREWELPGNLRFDLPVDGLVDGERYRFEVLIRSDGNEYLLADPVMVRISIGLPDFLPRPQRFVTLDSRPQLSWDRQADPDRQWPVARIRVTVVPDGSVSGDMGEVAGDAESYRPDAALLTTAAIRDGAQYTWTVRAVSEGGVLGRSSSPGTIVYDLDESIPLAVTGGQGVTIVERPVLRWTEIDGAEGYRFELYAGDDSELVSIATQTPVYALDVENIEEALAGQEGRSLRWRVAVDGPDGLQTEWSRSYTVLYQNLMPSFFSIIPNGASMELAMGLPAVAADRAVSGSEPDERPQIQVAMQRPFAMARYELSNRIVAQIATTALGRGLLREENGRILYSLDGRVVLGLQDLEFGSQFGLEGIRDAAGILTAIRVRSGYESHPAVGVSWYGAVYMANELSLMEGREPVYVMAGDSVQAHPNRDGYRLPTEAEWAFAASLTEASRSSSMAGWADENRVLTALEIRSANYLRSGDRWEDVNPPYTSAGGPTTPVGVLGIGNAAGIDDLLGNVWEWCWDWYNPRWYTRTDDLSDPVGPTEAVPDTYGRLLRVVRGGAWNTARSDLRLSNRGAFDPETGSFSIGVRLVYTIR